MVTFDPFPASVARTSDRGRGPNAALPIRGLRLCPRRSLRGPWPSLRAQKYTLAQLDQAHADYLVYLEQCFESKKHACGAGHKRLEFIGKSVKPRPRARL